MYPHRMQDSLSSEDIALIQARESFYIHLTNPDGWPYVQHRGGPVGFLRAHTTSHVQRQPPCPAATTTLAGF